MFLLLDNPISTGGLDAKDYTTLRIDNMHGSVSGRRWRYDFMLGYIDSEGDFVPGVKVKEYITVTDAEFLTFFSAKPQSLDESLGQFLARRMYVVLQFLRPEYSGTPQ